MGKGDAMIEGRRLLMALDAFSDERRKAGIEFEDPLVEPARERMFSKIGNMPDEDWQAANISERLRIVAQSAFVGARSHSGKV